MNSVVALVTDLLKDEDPPFPNLSDEMAEQIVRFLDDRGVLAPLDDDGYVTLRLPANDLQLLLQVGGEVIRLDHPDFTPNMSERDQVLALALCEFVQSRIRHAGCVKDVS